MSEAPIRRATSGDARAIAQVRVDAWRSTYKGIIPQAYLDAMSVDASESMWQRVLESGSTAASVFVAEMEGQVIGFAASHRLEPPKLDLDAELTAIYVAQSAQRAGLGRRLVHAVAQAQGDAGAHGLLTWVIAGNKGARAFYEALGGEVLVEQPFEWDGLELVETGYGWRDLQQLSEKTQ